MPNVTWRCRRTSSYIGPSLPLAPAIAPENIDNTAIVLGEALNEVAPIADDPIAFARLRIPKDDEP